MFKSTLLYNTDVVVHLTSPDSPEESTAFATAIPSVLYRRAVEAISEDLAFRTKVRCPSTHTVSTNHNTVFKSDGWPSQKPVLSRC